MLCFFLGRLTQLASEYKQSNAKRAISGTPSKCVLFMCDRPCLFEFHRGEDSHIFGLRVFTYIRKIMTVAKVILYVRRTEPENLPSTIIYDSPLMPAYLLWRSDMEK